MKKLNAEYWVEEHHEVRDGGVEYSVYAPLFPCIALFSEREGQPLYALQLKPTETKKVQGVIYPRPILGINQFHGLLDNDNAEFGVVATNLCNDGNIYFNVMRGSTNALNEINVLASRDSCLVASDQHAEHKALILKTIEASTGQALTVHEDEAKATAEKKNKEGLSLTSTASPEQNTAMINLFTQPSLWRTVEHIVLVNEIKTKKKQMGRHISMEEEEEESGEETGEENECFYSSNGTKAKGAKKTKMRSFETRGKGVKCHEKKNKEKKSVEKWIGESQAAQLSYGSTIKVASQKSDIQFAYHVQTPPCVLGLSVETRLEFVVTTKEAQSKAAEDAKKLVEAYVARKYDDFLTKATHYDSPQCCICLEEESPPDIVFFQCGHCCTHKNCSEQLQTCPFCRARIDAKLTCK